jgi:predicted dehydrogenase
LAVFEKLNIGIVGACGRGASFKGACAAVEGLRIHAVCDINTSELENARERLGASESYTDFESMIEQSELDAVILGTPMPYHVPQAVIALKENLHVLSEVPAGISLKECRELVAACRASRGIYAMAENYIYTRPNIMVREIAGQGLFGKIYYGEGEYLHELKELNERTPWRRKWQTGVNGITYGTHSLGPLLQWMEGDRVVSVCCSGSGHHYRDPGGDLYENEDSCVMLCRTQGGGLLKIRVDMLSDRPHAMNIHSLQGTDGCYESPRAPGEQDRIWLRSRCENANEWMDLRELEEEFLPDYWRKPSEAALQAGHGGGDYFEMVDFAEAVIKGKPPLIGIHEAMDLTLPGLMSQRSIAEDGRWMEVPDSRSW